MERSAQVGEASLRPGDMFGTIDPYSGGGTHLPDITVAAPLFYEGTLSASPANIAHHASCGVQQGSPTSPWKQALR